MKKIWVNGCFDILHIGHIGLLKYARSLGDGLIVGIDSDRRVKKLKGDDRPFNTVMDRYNILYAIKYVDSVSIFDTEEELEDIIKTLNIHTMVVGDDYKYNKVIGLEYVKEVKYFEKIKGYSTTRILNNIKHT